MEDREQKMWESAYSVMNHPRMGPYMHGAAMLERTSGVAHLWLVRGTASESVVQELQRQLGQAYALRRHNQVSKPRPALQHRVNERRVAGLLRAAFVSVVGAITGRSV